MAEESEREREITWINLHWTSSVVKCEVLVPDFNEIEFIIFLLVFLKSNGFIKIKYEIGT